MGLIKTLETNRLILRKLKNEDAEHIFKTWASDEEVTKYMRWSTHKSLEETKQWILYEEKNCKSDKNYTWGIVLKESGELIGSMGANYKENSGRYEIGYVLAKEYWRKGYATEATKCMMNYLINEVGIKRFEAAHARENPASGAVMRKVGFRFVEDTYFEKFDKSEIMESKKYYLDIENDESDLEMEEINLVKPIKEYEEQAKEYKKEYFNNGSKGIHAAARWDKMDNYDEWLNLLKEHSSFETIKDNWTVHTTFFGIRKSDNKIIGMIDIRHDLTNDFLRNYAGHIGYSVRPSERRKGYATQMLNKALDFCKNELKLGKVMINCNKENEGSRKTILKAGGMLEKEHKTEDGENILIHWVYL